MKEINAISTEKQIYFGRNTGTHADVENCSSVCNVSEINAHKN